MPLFDLPVEALRTYAPEIAEPDDFDAFWSGTVAEAREHPLAVDAEPVDTGLRTVEVHDVTFAGYGGQPVRAWYSRPAGVDEALPAVVQYQGYGGGRGLAHENILWASAGYASLFMDVRGQGASWGSGGHTPDAGATGPAAPGSMTRGIEDPAGYYYRRLFADGVRAVEAVRALPGVDATRVAVTGKSQGGAVALAVAGLVPDLVAVAPDVPFLCHVRRGVEIAGKDPFAEVARYLSVHRAAVDTVFRTLSYVDAANFARRATAPALFSVALMDMTCPPSTVFAAYNLYGQRAGSPPAKEIVEYPFNDHEGGDAHHVPAQLAFLDRHLRPA